MENTRKSLSFVFVFVLAFTGLFSFAFILPTASGKKAQAFTVGGDPNSGGSGTNDSPCPSCSHSGVPSGGGGGGPIAPGTYINTVYGASAFGGENAWLMEQQRYVRETSKRVEYPYPYGTYSSDSNSWAYGISGGDTFKAQYRAAGSPCRAVNKYYYDNVANRVVEDSFWGQAASNDLGVAWTQTVAWTYNGSRWTTFGTSFNFFSAGNKPNCISTNTPGVYWRECPVSVENVSILGPYGKLVNPEGPDSNPIVIAKNEDNAVELKYVDDVKEEISGTGIPLAGQQFWAYEEGAAPGSFATKWNNFQKYVRENDIAYKTLPFGVYKDWYSVIQNSGNLPADKRDEAFRAIFQYGLNTNLTQIKEEVENCGPIRMQYNFSQNGLFTDDGEQVQGIDTPGNYEIKANLNSVRCEFFTSPLWEEAFTVPGARSDASVRKLTWQRQIRHVEGTWYGCEQNLEVVPPDRPLSGAAFWLYTKNPDNWRDLSKKTVIQNVSNKMLCFTTDKTQKAYYDSPIPYDEVRKETIVNAGFRTQEYMDEFGKTLIRVVQDPNGGGGTTAAQGGRPNVGVLSSDSQISVDPETGQTYLNPSSEGGPGDIPEYSTNYNSTQDILSLEDYKELENTTWYLPTGSRGSISQPEIVQRGLQGIFEFQGVFRENEEDIDYNALWWSNRSEDNLDGQCGTPTPLDPTPPIVACDFDISITPEGQPAQGSSVVVSSDGTTNNTVWALQGNGANNVPGADNLIVQDGVMSRVVEVKDRKTYLGYSEDEGYAENEVEDQKSGAVESTQKLYPIKGSRSLAEIAKDFENKEPLEEGNLLVEGNGINNDVKFFKGTKIEEDTGEAEEFKVSLLHTFLYDYEMPVYEMTVEDGVPSLKVNLKLFEDQPGACVGEAKFAVSETRIGN